MTQRSTPFIATWVLQVFCRGAEHESVTGDLLEQYQNGKGRFWYWRQVLGIVMLALYRKVERRPLIRRQWISITPDGPPVAVPPYASPKIGQKIDHKKEGVRPPHLHRGINAASIAGEGLEGLPGLLVMIFFVFTFISLFLPRDSQWFLVLFLIVEAGAGSIYILAGRREKKSSDRSMKALHGINQSQDR
jgi:hypothetical protein